MCFLVKLIFYWINKDHSILNETIFASKLQIWPSFCKLLNSFETFLVDYDAVRCKLMSTLKISN